MTRKDYPLTPEEFRDIYSKVPRLTVEVIVKSEQGILLSLRDIEPYKGFWHIPGGTVFFDELLTDAVRRVARREMNLTVKGQPEFMGYIEYPGYYGKSFDHPVGMAFAIEYEGEPRPNHEAAELRWFAEIPDKIPPDQAEFISRRVL